MLSEREFLRAFPDAWALWTPGLGPAFLAQLRPAGSLQACVQHWADPLVARVPAAHNDLVAEIAFGWFSRAQANGCEVARLEPARVQAEVDDAIDRLSQLRRGSGFAGHEVTDAHRLDAGDLATRLQSHLTSRGTPLRIHRQLKGVGLLADCHPDIIQGETLIEVKMSKASFRTADLRQTLIYAAMAHWNGIAIRELMLLNPRLGLSWRFDLQMLVIEVADCRPGQLFDSIRSFLCDERWV